MRRAIPWAKPWDREDVAQYILGQLVLNDVIGQYDPDFTGRNGRPVSFRSFILAKASLYCRGRSQALATHYGRELSIADAPVGDGSSSWVEQVADEGADAYAFLDDADALESLRGQLAARPPAPGQPGLLDLFDELRVRVDKGKPVSTSAVRKRFKLNAVQAAGYLEELRAELRSAVAQRPGEALADLGVARLPAHEVQAAADLLKAAEGNQVVKVWERAGHRLAGYGKTWYLAPAKAELVRYGYLRGARGGHYEGGHGSPVKRGLIHWLERMATGKTPPPPMPDPEPDVQETWLDMAEAALWRAPGATLEQIESALELIKMMFGGSALWASGYISSSAMG